MTGRLNYIPEHEAAIHEIRRNLDILMSLEADIPADVWTVQSLDKITRDLDAISARTVNKYLKGKAA